MAAILQGRQAQFYIDIVYGIAFMAAFGYLLVADMDARVAAFAGGLVLGYFLRVWENMSIYERILRESVAEEVAEQVPLEAEERVAQQVEERIPDEIEEQVAAEVHSEAEERVAEEVEEHVDRELDDRIDKLIDKRLAEETNDD